MRTYRQLLVLLSLLSGSLIASTALSADEPTPFAALDKEYGQAIRPLLARYCLDCHAKDVEEGDLDLEQFARLADVRRGTKIWLKVVEMIDNGEMPPKSGRRLPAAERKHLRAWIDRYLKAEAYASAGDPGPVLLRRLNNAEYTYTIQDLTGIPLTPAREFPADSAAGEGFTNTGNALVMSPALLTKYFDAAKGISEHLVLLPSGVRFSKGTTRQDWTNEVLDEIRTVYAQFADAEGKLPIQEYLSALLEEREKLAKGSTTSLEVLAKQRGLNARYLASLHAVLNEKSPSLIVADLQAAWRSARPSDAPAIAAKITQWQKSLFAFQNVGHMKPWVVPVNPVTTRQALSYKFPEALPGKEVSIFVAVGNAGQTSGNPTVILDQPRLVLPGRADLPLRDVREFTAALFARRDHVFRSTSDCLQAAAEAQSAQGKFAIDDLARRHRVDPEVLSAWLDFLGIGSNAQIRVDLYKQKLPSTSGYDFVKGWGLPELPSLVANSSDQTVRIPGTLKGHGVAVHPSPTLASAVGWRSPIVGTLKVAGTVTHAHPECGNGVAWSLEIRRGATRQRLAAGVAAGAKPVAVGPIASLNVQKGDLISLLIGPRDGNHSCDLTDIALTLSEQSAGGMTWDLSADVSSDVLAGNPHADRLGNPDVWSFYSEPVQGSAGPIVPAGSSLARWLATGDVQARAKLALDVQKLLTDGPPAAKDHPDATLYRQLASLAGPLFGGRTLAAKPGQAAVTTVPSTIGLDPSRFGRLADGTAIAPTSLPISAGSILEIKLPADLLSGTEFVTSVILPPSASDNDTVQAWLAPGKTDTLTALRNDVPILVADRPAARARIDQAFSEFRTWFPAALCYTKIVPVDEVVTLTLFHREDEPLRRLMLNPTQIQALDRYWNELHFVSHDALTLVDAFAQLMEYATQDSDPRLFEPFRKPINERAAAFRKALVEAEPSHLTAILDFAAKAYRRPVTDAEAKELRSLYARLRQEELPHDEATRLTLARVLVSPAFLYRIEKAGPGAKPSAVSDWELASRLSYFLWSSMPDDELRTLASSGQLHNPDILAAQARRMIGDPKARRLATEFACQWLHVYDFDALDEKSERHFPSFLALRKDMYEETIRYFTDLFQRDSSILTIFDSDHTFLNEALAKHYGLSGVTGAEWRRVDGVRSKGRGGILGLSTTLAKQSGASRTSPILRGNWISEVLLGEKLPKPPKDVPRLPEDEAASTLTVRQLVERHTQDVRCFGCHQRIDPLGYALESYDAIGRLRSKDLADRPIDSHAKLRDGTQFDGLDGLRRYLAVTRREAVVRQFEKKLLGYALGRGIQLSDEPLLEEIRVNLDRSEHRFSAALETIVRSHQFREIRGRDAVSLDETP